MIVLLASLEFMYISSHLIGVKTGELLDAKNHDQTLLPQDRQDTNGESGVVIDIHEWKKCGGTELPADESTPSPVPFFSLGLLVASLPREGTPPQMKVRARAMLSMA